MDYYSRKYFVQHVLQVARHIHFEILKLSHELNQAYTYQILLDLIVQFLLILCTLYNLYFYLKSFNISEPLSNIGIIGFLIWISLNLIKIIFINNHCTNLYREIQITTHLLRQLEICYLDNSIRDEVQQFSLQVLLHPLKFTAGGYILNNKLSTMFFGNIMTSIIILIQINITINALKNLLWIPKSQYASLIHIIIFNEIFGLRVFEWKKRLQYGWSILYVEMESQNQVCQIK
ncbi:uncharacterized protein LOC122715533 [Apis laboriosa]|uniref:uncharacterized protein LOC122715533 n=1 Tax=Apis laboriosa TaxID=183418 RepID=UPI001CC62B3A|nr:uncharacterized protein LOC122715533 [Apis laboriosa]